MSDLGKDHVRLNKLMADRGLCSRREADKLIEAGFVKLSDGVVAKVGQRVAPDCELTIEKEADSFFDERYVIILNKPIGVVSNLPENGQKQATDLIGLENCHSKLSRDKISNVLKHRNKLAVAGRLDRASRGLLVLSNDGRVIREITQSTWCKKTYLVTLFQEVVEDQVKRLTKKRHLGKWDLLPMQVEAIGARKLKFVLQEGKKHQIRDCCRSVGLSVKDLFRLKIGPLELGNLPSGHWSLLSSSEVKELLPNKG